jgi:hypothetical protein
MLELINKVLSAIPLNGYKTLIGVLLSILAAANAVLTTADGQAVLAALMTHPIDWIAVITLLVGLIHKYVKAKANAIQ